MSSREALHEPLPVLDGVTNFRELGGLTAAGGRRILRGRLLRSGHWGRATEADVAQMARLGIELVFDFRSDADIAIEGEDRLPEGTELIRLPATDPAGAIDLRSLILESGPAALKEHFGEGRAAEKMRLAAAALVTDRSHLYGEFLSRLSERSAPPSLFHCSAGKDRAGWAASVILFALDVAEPDVIEHYLLSNEHYRPGDPGAQLGPRRALPGEILSLLAPLLRVLPEYAASSIAAAHEQFGSIEGYLREGLGLTDRKREQLRENWLG